MKVMLKCVNVGAMTVKRGQQTTGNARVMWSDGSSFMLFLTSATVYVWRTHKETSKPECLVPTVKYVRGSLMVQAAISRYSLGPIISLHGRITAREYVGR
jgi:hypothetical protein